MWNILTLKLKKILSALLDTFTYTEFAWKKSGNFHLILIFCCIGGIKCVYLLLTFFQTSAFSYLYFHIFMHVYSNFYS